MDRHPPRKVDECADDEAVRSDHHTHEFKRKRGINDPSLLLFVHERRNFLERCLVSKVTLFILFLTKHKQINPMYRMNHDTQYVQI